MDLRSPCGLAVLQAPQRPQTASHDRSAKLAEIFA